MSDQSYIASIVEMVTPESFAAATNLSDGKISAPFDLYRRACLAAVRLTPIPTIAVYGDGSDQARRENVLHTWMKRAVATRDEFGRRAAARMH